MVGWYAFTAVLVYIVASIGALCAQTRTTLTVFNLIGKCPVEDTKSFKTIAIACLGIMETLAIYGFVVALILVGKI